jgi:hypothetical protein
MVESDSVADVSMSELQMRRMLRLEWGRKEGMAAEMMSALGHVRPSYA